jgi:hypothetical protein
MIVATFDPHIRILGRAGLPGGGPEGPSFGDGLTIDNLRNAEVVLRVSQQYRMDHDNRFVAAGTALGQRNDWHCQEGAMTFGFMIDSLGRAVWARRTRVLNRNRAACSWLASLVPGVGEGSGPCESASNEVA